VGAINGGQSRARAVRIPRDTLLTFKIGRIPAMRIGRSDGSEEPSKRKPRQRLFQVARIAIIQR
jgi:hypothetical protein